MQNRKRKPVKKDAELAFSGDSIVWKEEELNKLKSEEQAVLESEHQAQIEKELKEEAHREKLQEERLRKLEEEAEAEDVPNWERIIMGALSRGEGERYGFD